MSSPEIFLGRKGGHGFTLIELILVGALFAVLAVPISYGGIAAYRAEVLSQTRSGVVEALRSAQTDAASGKYDAVAGVRFEEEAYVIFSGDSFLTGTETLRFPIPRLVAISGPEEITFARVTGMPSVTGSIVISTTGREAVVRITERGNIE